jgi:hypothetical protein
MIKNAITVEEVAILPETAEASRCREVVFIFLCV